MGTAKTETRAAPRLYLVTPPSAIRMRSRTIGRCAQRRRHRRRAAAPCRRRPDRTARAHQGAAHPDPVERAALLLDGHADLVARAETDGAHLTGIDAFKAATPALKPARIAGCGGLVSRHDAMLAGESGADYVMFGEPDANGRTPSFEAVLERVTWWAETLTIPCVAYAASLAEADALAAAGADFIAVGENVWRDARAVVQAAHLGMAEPVR